MWLRLSDLRGFEELMVDFAEEPGELQLLIDLVRDYNLGEIRRILEGRPPGMIYFGDDLGMQTSLAIGAAKWRSYLKPCYAAFYSLCHGARQDVYMHTDGHLLPIVDDLIECGVDVLNPQIRANGLEGLVRTCKAKVCVDLDLDRQLMPFATPAEMDEHIRECTAALGAPEGGLWLKAEIGPDVPLANVKAIFAALERYRGMFA
jgi:uroporphyrinogen-III decarboxylase